MGFVWQEIKQLWNEGAKAYVTDMWNLLDFATNALYIATITLRGVAWYRVRQDGNLANIHRQYWDAYDPTLISECLFATANIFSMLKLVYIFTVNPHLGPLQISLGRMLSDILKFLFVVVLVLSSFACGFNQLYWFYAYERNKYCKDVKLGFGITGSDLEKYQYCVTRGRTFSNLFEITQTLYWSTYGLIDLSNTDLEYEHSFTEFVGKLMYGVFSAITFVVLLNMLIAMMNCSYESIATQADTEWKFARSKLWISYFEEGGTLPVPFNIIPSPKSFLYIATWMKERLCSCSKQHQRSKWQSIRKVVKRVNEREARYQTVMRDLVKRYLMVRQRLDERQGVTEDDLNEIKGDISAFRFELLEILRTNGMKTPAYTQHRATKLRRRGSKRSMQSRRLGKFDAISEESGAGAFSSCGSAGSLALDQQQQQGGGGFTCNAFGSPGEQRAPIRSFSQPGGFEDCATRPELTLNASQLRTGELQEGGGSPTALSKKSTAAAAAGGGVVTKKVSFGGEESVDEDGAVFPDEDKSPRKRTRTPSTPPPKSTTSTTSSIERRSDLV
ncbi:hypothetical protein BOX15_Mlig005824g1 [Macrostomum lignano]|uniref:Ion transport domain-containing protein n=1 Tax=Macrostomum lignano TaxID=282301 RepID=A0A267EM21_9PLAT|nr:hypothetical protein BOX15_Mlig005824g1 [Macrostomum lignano]